MKLYRLSKSNLNGKIIKPTIPDNFFTRNGYEENKTPRVCFATTIDKCLMALSYNCDGDEFFVHIPDNYNYRRKKPTVHEVPDSAITSEIWILEPVKLKCIGKIKAKIPSGDDSGIPFKYGNNTAELYNWDFKWINKLSEVQQIYNELIGGSCYEN